MVDSCLCLLSFPGVCVGGGGRSHVLQLPSAVTPSTSNPENRLTVYSAACPPAGKVDIPVTIWSVVTEGPSLKITGHISQD